ncbi:Cj0069 family protein [Corynebacterium tuberculostearicum]|uniref:Cj0069 family protein n=1 Tax=Corynebacterium tuberculostearicum TaxID=38304 RepID=UPI0019566460|nr:Cj0069 family protein [Corynebacterium tuberculostearicum]
MEPGTGAPARYALKCTEAVDNQTHDYKLGAFMDFCDQYIEGDNGMLVDMRFMPRLVEGEIRILLVGDEPVFIVHKKPAEGGDNFSATLFSGAKYTYDKPESWPELLEISRRLAPLSQRSSAIPNVPLIWTADFMLDDAPWHRHLCPRRDHCSCVGFTSRARHGHPRKGCRRGNSSRSGRERLAHAVFCQVAPRVTVGHFPTIPLSIF